MNRKLLLALAVVGGLSAYLNTSSDDELLAAPKTKARRSGPAQASAEGEPSRTAVAQADASTRAVAPWVCDALTQGVAQWSMRSVQAEPREAAGRGVAAWAGVLPPPPPPVSAVPVVLPPPPPPVAPRFPHPWVGRFNDEALRRAVLSGPQSTWVVSEGDVIEGQWRVDAIRDRRMTLTYLPLNQQQTVGMK